MPVVMGTRGVLDRLFSPAGSPRTLFAPAGINGTAQASDVITLGRNGKTDAIWSLDQWDQDRGYHSTNPDPYLEVHGFEADHDQLVIRSGKGYYSLFAVETDADGDGKDDVLLGRYDYDNHGGGSGPGVQGFFDLFALLDDTSAADLATCCAWRDSDRSGLACRR